jgi:hypothetical protein
LSEKKLRENDTCSWKEHIHACSIAGISRTFRRRIALIGSQFKKSTDTIVFDLRQLFLLQSWAIDIHPSYHDQDSSRDPDSPRLLSLFSPVEV